MVVAQVDVDGAEAGGVAGEQGLDRVEAAMGAVAV